MNIKCSAKNSKYFKKLSHDINEYHTITSQTLTLRHCYVDLLLIFTKFYFIFQKMYKLPKIYILKTAYADFTTLKATINPSKASKTTGPIEARKLERVNEVHRSDRPT